MPAAKKKVAAPVAPKDGLSVVYRPTASLKPYGRNARTHSKAQVQEIASSIKEFGFTNPILLKPDGTIIAGHGRLEAAISMGIKSVPTITLANLTDAQCRALALADNRIALNAGWDMELLKVEIGDLMTLGIDPLSLGFNENEISRLLGARPGLTDEDEVPETPTDPVAREGDVWKLGRHILVCGDSTKADTVAKCLGDVKPHLMVTDPPYGVEYDPEWRNDAAQAGYSSMGRGAPGGRAVGVVLNDNRADWSDVWALFPGSIAYVWHAGINSHVVAESLIGKKFVIRSQIIWAKNNMVISRCHYHPQHEPCFYAVRTGKTANWTGDRKQTTLWQIDKPMKSETGHSTQKPVECMRRPIENSSSVGQAVYEPFSGSGTTIIAAEQTDRACHAIELNPAYVDVAILRWQSFTGQNAILQATGQTFTEVAGDRTPDKVMKIGKPVKEERRPKKERRP